MAAVNPPILTFQGGVIGEELQNRVDIQSYPAGAAELRNMRPSLQGPMTRRPPMIHVDEFEDHTKKGELFPFVYSVDASYLVEATEDGFRFFANDGLITAPSVTSALTGSWSDQSTGAGAMSIVGSNIWLDSDGGSRAIAQHTITIGVSDQAKVHVIAFEIGHGPLDIRIGTTPGNDDILAYERLREGIHRLAFTPGAASVYVQFRNTANAGRYFKNTVSILAGPDYVLPCPYAEADLAEVHVQQIRDVLYMVHNDYWPRRLERRGDRSWSIVKLLPDDGPFGDLNTSDITLEASATSGEVTLTASDDLFTSNDVGVLYQLTGSGQTRTKTASSADQFTESIKVTGIGSAARTFNLEITGAFTATVTLQRSSGNENNFTDWQTYTAATNVNVYDAQDNQTWFIRVGIKTGNYTSGTINMTLTYTGGSSSGVVRVVEYTNATEVTAEVLEGQTLASTQATRTWKRGDWNVTDGFPNAITDGYARLWFGRGAKIWASKSDDFTNFEEVVDEDDAAFSRNLATPSSDAIRWLANGQHLIIGTSSVEKVGLGNTNSDPIGPANFQFLPGSEEGGAAIQPVTAVGSVLFVHRSKRKLMQFVQNPKALSETSYISVDLMARAPELLDADIVSIAVQREPERRIYVVLSSGRLCELLFRREGELDVVAWSIVPTDGRVERVCVLPREDEDYVYFIVRRRNAAGDWERFIERYGREQPYMDCDRFHLDAALGYELTCPDTVATPSDVTGEITIETDEAAFTIADEGKVIWINGGRATIDTYVSTTIVEATVTSELKGLHPNAAGTDPCPSGMWGFKSTASTLSGLDHLEGREVRVWGDMTDLGTYTVSGGSITLSQAVSVAYAGLPYTSRWKSLKLSYGAQKGTALGMMKGIKELTLLLYKTAASLTYGYVTPQLRMADAERREVKIRNAEVPYGEPIPLYTGEKRVPFASKYDPDLRVFFEIDGPAPATIAGYVPVLDEKDR